MTVDVWQTLNQHPARPTLRDNGYFPVYVPAFQREMAAKLS